MQIHLTAYASPLTSIIGEMNREQSSATLDMLGFALYCSWVPFDQVFVHAKFVCLKDVSLVLSKRS